MCFCCEKWEPEPGREQGSVVQGCWIALALNFSQGCNHCLLNRKEEIVPQARTWSSSWLCVRTFQFCYLSVVHNLDLYDSGNHAGLMKSKNRLFFFFFSLFFILKLTVFKKKKKKVWTLLTPNVVLLFWAKCRIDMSVSEVFADNRFSTPNYTQ